MGEVRSADRTIVASALGLTTVGGDCLEPPLPPLPVFDDEFLIGILDAASFGLPFPVFEEELLTGTVGAFSFELPLPLLVGFVSFECFLDLEITFFFFAAGIECLALSFGGRFSLLDFFFMIGSCSTQTEGCLVGPRVLL